MEMRIKYDLHYIRNWSLWFDFKIVLFTVFRGFNDKNAH
jgi:putative colanic acid biosynthesis UDP-glucose lipid carrier transferase